MAYTHTTFGQLKTQLAARLGDASKIFWVDTELGLAITEAMRTFGVLSAFWRERGTLAASTAQAFYDLSSLLSGGTALLGYSVTDRDLVRQIQYHLLEPAASQATWTGTEMFSLDEIRYAVQRRRDQFIADTGIVLTRSLVPVLSPPIGREQLSDDIIDVRRAAWLGASPFNYYQHLWREDERALTGYDAANWSMNSTTPYAYSVMAPPPLQVQIAPPPISSGQLEVITVNTGAALNPAASATVLGIPDDLTWVVKWGALADLLGQDGPARDPARAGFAEQRYLQGVALARMLPVVVNAELNGVPLIPCTLNDLDAGVANWENSSGTPTDIALAGANLIGLYPVPDALYSVTLDVVRRAPIPSLDGDQVQVGREQLDMIIDYAEHLALFKIHGAEWQASVRQSQNFLLQSITYNRRLSAAARYVIAPKESSQREKAARPRRIESEGLGALPSGRGVENA